MKTNKVGLTRLISALEKPAAASPNSARRQADARRAYGAVPNVRPPVTDDAVKLSPGFGRSAQGASDPTARAAKVAELKEKVENGEFKPNSEQVASAFISELNI